MKINQTGAPQFCRKNKKMYLKQILTVTAYDRRANNGYRSF